MHRIEPIAQPQRKRHRQELRVHPQRFRPQPPIPTESQPVHNIRMRRIVSCRIRHVRGDNMDILAAQTAVNLIEPDRRAALGREKKFRDD